MIFHDEDSLEQFWKHFWNASAIPKFTKSEAGGNLAGNMAIQAMNIFKYLLKTRKEDERVDLVCCVGGKEFSVQNVGPFVGDTIFLESIQQDGTTFCFYALIDQVSFMYVVSPITNNIPQREVGFHTTMEAEQKPDKNP